MQTVCQNRFPDRRTDFLAGKTADHWREAVDKINLGKMPKKGKVDPQEAFQIVEWVNQELRNAGKRAQSTGAVATLCGPEMWD
jgi:hypothetical protein